MNLIAAVCIASTVVIAINVRIAYGNFDLVLKSQSSGSYINYTGIPNLGSFSVCFWLKQEYSRPYWAPQTILSYANDDFKNALEFRSIGGVFPSGISIDLYGANVYLLHANMQDPLWHHYCFTFDNKKLKLACYVDGIQKCDRDIIAIVKDPILKGGGCLIIGYNQKKKCLPPDNLAGFTGLLSQINIWSDVLEPNDVIKVFEGCKAYHGNVLSWKFDLLDKFIVRENIQQPSTACVVEYISRTYLQKENRMLIGHTLSQQTASSALYCAHECLKDQRCRSFNHYEDRKQNNCELNDSDDFRNPDDLSYKPNACYGTYVGKLERLAP